MTNTDYELLVGRGDGPVVLQAAYATRHGLIAGATGTGKTVTMQVLAEGFSRMGVPVFMADVKGDLSGISQAGKESPRLRERARQVGCEEFVFEPCPTMFWDLYGRQGHPLRTTVSEMGPLLLARLLELNETQEGVLTILFRVADDEGLLLLDLKDLQAMLGFVSENRSALSQEYGNITPASVAAIRRRLLMLEEQGATHFFGEPALELRDFMRVDEEGRGYMNVLAADQLMQSPRLYATFLLWLMAELFEELPETGDVDKPRLVFFFDEAHLLFSNAPRALLEKVELVVRLVRSKGVGVFFVSQNPQDIPEQVLGQLGNRVQHALRAFTARDRKAVRAAAQTFRDNPALDVETVISELAVGEALVSTLGEKGIPSMVQRTLIAPPASRMGPLTRAERSRVMADSPVSGKYEESEDRKSAYEHLRQRGEKALASEQAIRRREAQEQGGRPARQSASQRGNRQGIVEAMAKSVVRSIGSSLGRRLARGLLGSLLKG